LSIETLKKWLYLVQLIGLISDFFSRLQLTFSRKAVNNPGREQVARNSLQDVRTGKPQGKVIVNVLGIINIAIKGNEIIAMAETA
jgi:hypothetical protein